MTLRHLQLLIIADIIVGFSLVYVGYSGDPFLASSLKAIEDSSMDYTSPFMNTVALTILIPEMILIFSAWILLWFGRPLGRILYISAIFTGILFTAFSNYIIVSGPIYLLESIWAMISFAIMILPFLPPLSSVFQQSKRAEQGAAANP